MKVFNICAFSSNRHCIIVELSGFLHCKTNSLLFKFINLFAILLDLEQTTQTYQKKDVYKNVYGALSDGKY